MAEYIDREKFKRKLIDKKSFFPVIVARALDEMTIADVVPKSAYDQLRWERDTAIEQLKEVGLSFGEKTDGYGKKVDVAREIFEEIEKVATVYKLDGDFYIDNGLYAELKKKYTEGTKNE